MFVLLAYHLMIPLTLWGFPLNYFDLFYKLKAIFLGEVTDDRTVCCYRKGLLEEVCLCTRIVDHKVYFHLLNDPSSQDQVLVWYGSKTDVHNVSLYHVYTTPGVLFADI